MLESQSHNGSLLCNEITHRPLHMGAVTDEPCHSLKPGKLELVMCSRNTVCCVPAATQCAVQQQMVRLCHCLLLRPTEACHGSVQEN